MTAFAIYECTDSACALRFPLAEKERAPRRCPRCGGALTIVALAQSDGDHGGDAPVDSPPVGGLSIELLIDNVRSAFNVGSMLRSGEAAALRRVWLCGITPAPDHSRVARAALGAEERVAWECRLNAVQLGRELLEEGALLWALEAEEGATPLQKARLPALSEAPGGLVLVAGSEVAGIDPGLRELCALAICLPMRGRKRSLNVAVAAGVALQWLALQRDGESPLGGEAAGA